MCVGAGNLSAQALKRRQPRHPVVVHRCHDVKTSFAIAILAPRANRPQRRTGRANAAAGLYGSWAVGQLQRLPGRGNAVIAALLLDIVERTRYASDATPSSTGDTT